MFSDMTLLQYINSEDRGFFLPDMGTNGLFLINKKAYEVYDSVDLQLELAKTMDKYFDQILYTHSVMGLHFVKLWV
ncbi:uroporphyrinogen decarboxylase domain protein [Clostridioides difficile CD39]|nr:hypothetical protein [Clostridioides difficile]EQE48901.1 uroporphyrinogen decarboxylase domain protein [Clostridioides difficile CD39]